MHSADANSAVVCIRLLIHVITLLQLVLHFWRSTEPPSIVLTSCAVNIATRGRRSTWKSSQVILIREATVARSTE